MNFNKILDFLESKYPKKYALSWDNVGLQIGSTSSDVKKILISLNISDKEAQHAINNNVDAIISHHPLIFRSLNNINTDSPTGKLIQYLLQNNISVYSMHTNFDVFWNGMSDILAKEYELKNIEVIKNTGYEPYCKLVVYVPEQNFEKFKTSFLDLEIGHIGNYSHCSFYCSGTGTFKPLDGTNPYIGKKGKLEITSEFKIETIVKEKDLEDVINQMIEIHPYEEIAYDIYKLDNKKNNIGLGRIGECSPIRIQKLLEKINGTMKGSFIAKESTIKRIAVCAGSGGNLISDAANKEAEVYISGDISYHDSLEAESYGLPIIDIGHHESEKHGISYIANMLRKKFKNDITVIEIED